MLYEDDDAEQDSPELFDGRRRDLALLIERHRRELGIRVGAAA